MKNKLLLKINGIVLGLVGIFQIFTVKAQQSRIDYLDIRAQPAYGVQVTPANIVISLAIPIIIVGLFIVALVLGIKKLKKKKKRK